MTAESTGILAIWNDCAPGREADFEAWFQGEHLAERLGVPGFRRGRRHEAVEGAPAVFTCYETETPEVLTGEAYLARVNDPTPLTREVMAHVFRNMNRTVCRVVARHGRMRGAWAVTVRLEAAPSERDLAVLAALADDPGVARAEAWAAAGAATESEESRLRGGDGRIAGCLLVETLREADARRARDRLAAERDGEAGIYRLLCELANAAA